MFRTYRKFIEFLEKLIAEAPEFNQIIGRLKELQKELNRYLPPQEEDEEDDTPDTEDVGVSDDENPDTEDVGVSDVKDVEDEEFKGQHRNSKHKCFWQTLMVTGPKYGHVTQRLAS